MRKSGDRGRIAAPVVHFDYNRAGQEAETFDWKFTRTGLQCN